MQLSQATVHLPPSQLPLTLGLPRDLEEGEILHVYTKLVQVTFKE